MQDYNSSTTRIAHWSAIRWLAVLPMMACLLGCSASDDETADDDIGIVSTLMANVEDNEAITRVHIADKDGAYQDAEDVASTTGIDLKTTFDNGDFIYASLSFERDGKQHPYVYSSGGIFTSTYSPLKFEIREEADKKQHLMAFYRGDYAANGDHRKELRNGYTFMVPTNQSTEKGTKNAPGFMDGEFLYAHTWIDADNTTTDALGNLVPKMTFKHKTARIILRVHLIEDNAIDARGDQIGHLYKAENVTEAYIGNLPSQTGKPTVAYYGSSNNGMIYTNSVVTLDESYKTTNANYGNVVLTTKTSDTNRRNVIKALRRQKDDKTVWFTCVFPPQTIQGVNSSPSYNNTTVGKAFFNVRIQRIKKQAKALASDYTAAELATKEAEESYLFPLLLTRTFEEGKVYYYDVHIGSHKPNAGV